MGYPTVPEHAPEGRDMTGGTNVDPGNADEETRQCQALMDAAEQEIADRHTGYGVTTGGLPESGGMRSMLSWAQDDVG